MWRYHGSAFVSVHGRQGLVGCPYGSQIPRRLRVGTYACCHLPFKTKGLYFSIKTFYTSTSQCQSGNLLIWGKGLRQKTQIRKIENLAARKGDLLKEEKRAF
ncbi:hypothetical protein OSB04_un001501 [Centaurea solstitialis]|uniref:Uncharacterized protein n=1 Tax=Centaurea solstitialis TaxID=347529 RepID=A0AA38W4Y7_9ASTR|nr:hypothetical protein OSB04_un001501 [Centaurea solstitialis]